MKRRLALILTLMALIAAGFGEKIYAGIRNAFGFESISVTSTVQSLSTTYVNAAGGTVPDISAYITMETGSCRWRADGTSPTDSLGHLLDSGESVSIAGYHNLKNFRAILSGSTTGTMMVTYEK